MDVDANVATCHLIISLPNGQELEHKRVPKNESLWSILLNFEGQSNQNLCKRFNKENRFELPQLLYNGYPFASTLSQLLSTTLSDLTKHKNKQMIKLNLNFKSQAFSINELNDRLSKCKQQSSNNSNDDSSMDVELKNNDSDNDENDNKKANGLDESFAKDIDPNTAKNTEEIFRKMEMLLYKLTKLLTTKDAFVGCLKFLKKIVNNLVLHPVDEKDAVKYRKLNLKNAKLSEKLFKYEPALQLLLLIGFEKDLIGSFLIMPAKNENVVVFQALIVKISNCQPPKAAIPVIDKDIKVYSMEDVRKFKVEEAQRIAQQNALKKESDSEMSLASQHRIAAQNAYKKAHPQQLMGKELREKKYGVQQKEYKFTLIRIEFPSKYILEAKFHPNTPIFKLFSFVSECLGIPLSQSKYKLLLPPHQVIKNKNDENQTFKSMGGMIPACTVRFVLDGKCKKIGDYSGKYIKETLIQKYFTKKITSLRDANLGIEDNADKDKQNEEAKSNGNNGVKKKNGKMTAAQFKAMKRQKALQNKLAKLNQQ